MTDPIPTAAPAKAIVAAPAPIHFSPSKTSEKNRMKVTLRIMIYSSLLWIKVMNKKEIENT